MTTHYASDSWPIPPTVALSRRLGTDFGHPRLSVRLARRADLGARRRIGSAVVSHLRVRVSFGLVHLPRRSSSEFRIVACTFGSGSCGLLADEAAGDAEKREVEARVLARESELKALKTQVNPHFIFNCLNSISALTSSDPAKAREMCVLLAEFLRKTLGLGERALIPLRDELSLLKAYLAVEQIRFSSRLKVEENTAAETLENLLPPLLLQPLVENAVRHGVAQLTEGGWIRIDIQQPEPEILSIAIENNFDPEAPRRKGSGIGLRNVRERLDASYGNRARFDVRANHDRFLVSLNLPAEKES
ncbi:MAG: hypothetical protein DMG95_03300 [Acidobacteria bacterium]|nr:MAG: hypothetical protein DMG95_03300 [Acidobacteriota bacterium]